MKIAINADFLNNINVGSGQYTYHVLNNILAMDGKNEYLLFVKDRVPDIKFDSENYRYEVVRFRNGLNKKMIEDIVFCGFIVASRGRKEGAKHLHVPFFAPPFVKKQKFIITIHDVAFFGCNTYKKDIKSDTVFRIKGYFSRNAEKVITCSEFSKKEIMRYLNVDGADICVTPYASDPDMEPEPDKDKIASFLRKKEIPTPYILYISGYDYRKNVRNLISAFSLLKEKRKIPHYLLLVGKYPERKLPNVPDMKAFLRETRHSEYVINVDNVPKNELIALFCGAELFAYPSLYEGFGLPVLEAMKCGCPVVTSNVSSLPEVAGDAGILVDPNDVESIADGIMQFIDSRDKRMEYVERGFKRAELFNWKRTAEMTMDIYRQVFSR